MTNDIDSIVTSRRSERLPADAATTLTHLLAIRVSCRAFRPEPVAEQTIREILATAQLTASWCNSQSWQVAVTGGAGTDRLRNALYTAAASGHTETPDITFPREYRGVHRDRRRESGYQLYNALGIERGDHQRQREQTLQNFTFFGAPHVAIIHTDEALGLMVRSTAAATSTTSCWLRPHAASAASPKPPWRCTPTFSARNSDSRRTVWSSAAFPSAIPTSTIRPTATAPHAPPLDEVVEWVNS